MPAISQLKQSAVLTDLKNKLFATPAGGVHQTFDVDENVSFDAARSDTDEEKGKWVGVTAKLYNFIIGEETGGSGSVGSDDVQYVGICKCPRPRAIRTTEYTDLDEGVVRAPDQPFGAYSPLQGGPVRFGVFCNAFNNDSSEAWEGIVDALGGDITDATNLGLGLLPGLSQFETPGAIGSAISTLVEEGLTDEPEEVSGDEIVCDTIDAVEWYRKVDQRRWTGRKWMIHTLDREEAWYLSQWFITLDTAIKPYDYVGAPHSAYYAHLESALDADGETALMDYAALLHLEGDPLEALATEFDLQETAILSARNTLRSASFEEVSARVDAALLRAMKQRGDREQRWNG